MPSVQMSLRDYTFSKILEFHVYLSIFSNQFDNWEFYILGYLNSLKKFRLFFNKCFSRKICSYLGNKTYSLDEEIPLKYYNDNSKLYSYCYSNKEGLNNYLSIRYIVI